MPAPGHSVTIGERPSARTAPSSTSNAFVVGLAERGPNDRAVLTRSLAEYIEKCGARTTDSARLYDAVDVAFREGCSAIYVSRLFGAGQATATEDLLDVSNDPTLRVSASSPGEWGNDIDVQATVDGSTFQLIISYLDETVETTPALADNTEAVDWAAANSSYVVLEDLSTVYDPTTDPKAQTIALIGGDDDGAAATTDDLVDALDRFTKDLGPGQVAAPGFTALAAQQAVRDHAADNNRRGVLDLPDGDKDALVSSALALRGIAGRYAASFGPWAIVPGVSRGTHRTVPYSAVQLGLIARAESESANPNVAAAGKRGRARYAYELTQHFTDAERESLNNAGANIAILIKGVVTTYGNRTLTNPLTDGDWKWFSASRLVMGVAAAANDVLANYDFEQIDGRGFIFSALKGDLAGRACLPFFLANALYGQTPDEAFQVNTGPDQNTPTTIENGEMHAQISLRVSESGELLTVEIVKVPTTESL